MSNSRRLTIGQNIDGGESGGGSINTSNYMTILALEDGLTAKLSTKACQYCIDGDGNWIDLPSGTTTQSINSGQTLSFKGNLTPGASNGIGTFTINKKCNLEGNCMSLLFGDNAANNYSLTDYGDYNDYAFAKLFYNCTSIIHVSESFLPATTLDWYCYQDMFYGCTSLTTAPELPATTLVNHCYDSMFSGCSSLTSAPELPATGLAMFCYDNMFKGCTSLTTAPELPATTLAYGCYNGMFRDCSSLTTAPELPATSLNEQCYSSMFSGCINLTTAPELPATYMPRSCYSSMFSGCINLTTPPKKLGTSMAVNSTTNYTTCGSMFSGCASLTTAPELPATRLAGSCYNSMFKGCTNLTTAPELPATTLNNNCYSYMFSGCTNLTTAPELPATTLTDSCYFYMFYGCSKLNYIKMLATNISASRCLEFWVNGVSRTGTFVKKRAMMSLSNDSSGIPFGWTVYNNGETDIDTTYSMRYTSSDGNIVTPYAYVTNAFGIAITSNTYKDGMGIITFAGPVITFKNQTFYNCSNLTSIIIPDSVTTIGDSAFYNCRSMTSVTIGDSVTTIGDSAFYDCRTLSVVYCKATTPPSLGDSYVFDYHASGRKIYVPVDSVNAYKSATHWSKYADAIVGYDFGSSGGSSD